MTVSSGIKIKKVDVQNGFLKKSMMCKNNSWQTCHCVRWDFNEANNLWAKYIEKYACARWV